MQPCLHTVAAAPLLTLSEMLHFSYCLFKVPVTKSSLLSLDSWLEKDLGNVGHVL